MKYSLDLDDLLEGEVRRIASRRLIAAAELLRSRPTGLDDAIHDARRHIKQCRALYRLIASEAGDFQQAENIRLGKIGRRLSGLRDAKALIEATQYLKREMPSKSNGMLMDRLARRLDQRHEGLTDRSADAADALAAAEQDLLDAADALAALSLPKGRRKAAACLARGWEKVGRKARAAIDAASHEHDEAFHDLRKRTQDRWMHAALMSRLWPSAMSAIQRQGKTLSDMLGHAQDLALLLEAVSGSGDIASDAVESEAIRETAMNQQKKLQGECRDFAAILFAESRPRDGRMIRQLLRGR
jgi:CHAD domain-containing protein